MRFIQSKSKENKKRKESEREESPTPFIKSLLGASVPPGGESDFRPTNQICD